jgi:hypothetical protein
MRHPIIVSGRGMEDVEAEVEGYLTIQTYMWELRGESLGVPTLLWIGIKNETDFLSCVLFLA